MDAVSIGSLIVFAAILALLVALRAKSEKFEIKTGDVMVALLPVAMYLLVTGKVKSLQVGDLKVESAIVEASAKPIASQVARQEPLPVEPVTVNAKATLGEIPRLANQQTTVLSFRLEYERYDGMAVDGYLAALLRQPYLKHLLILEPSGKFWALGDPRVPFDRHRFAAALNAGSKGDLRSVLPLQERSVPENADKQSTLKIMEDARAEVLPVVDSEGRFKGIVDRSRLTASLILDVAAQLKAK